MNERTTRAVLARVGLLIGVAVAGDIAFAVGYGWPSSALAFWSAFWLLGWTSQTAATTEWTIAGGGLFRRRWISRPAGKPSAVAALGPQVEIVHESWGRWSIRPYGLSIGLQPWQTSRLVGAMERAGVRVNDWHGEWTRRHRFLNAFGLLVIWAGGIAAFLAVALVPLRPGSTVSLVAFSCAVVALVLGLAIDFLPWSLRRPSARHG